MIFNEKKMYKDLLMEWALRRRIPEWHLEALRNSKMS